MSLIFLVFHPRSPFNVALPLFMGLQINTMKIISWNCNMAYAKKQKGIIIFFSMKRGFQLSVFNNKHLGY